MSSPFSSWVYLFSKFTPEALLLESLAIAAIGGVYTVTWFVNRRRIQADTQVPAGVVKDYLNMLITDAEYLRGQLFGLMDPGKVGPSHGVLAALGQAGAAPSLTTTISADDPQLAAKLAQFEAKMAEQLQAIARIEGEKTRLEQELAAARAGGGAGSDAGAKQKIDLLEAKLAEYSVIEDDLANLKRLQQENAQLKAQLAGGVAAASAAIASAAAAAPAAPVTSAEPVMDAIPEPIAEPVAEAEPAVAASEMAAPEIVATPNSEFENLVDQVEASIQDTPAEAPAAETAPPAPAGAEAAADTATNVDDLLAAAGLDSGSTPSTGEGADGTMGNDADLVAEFEKMLNG